MKFPYQRPTNFNYDLETTLITGKKKKENSESLLMKQLKRHVFTSTASRRCTCFCHQKQCPPGIALTESQTQTLTSQKQMCIAERNRPRGWEAGPRERKTDTQGAGVTGDMDFINSIYRKGMWELLSVLCLGRGSLCFWKWSSRIFVSAGVGKGEGVLRIAVFI